MNVTNILCCNKLAVCNKLSVNCVISMSMPVNKIVIMHAGRGGQKIKV